MGWGILEQYYGSDAMNGNNSDVIHTAHDTAVPCDPFSHKINVTFLVQQQCLSTLHPTLIKNDCLEKRGLQSSDLDAYGNLTQT